MTDTEQLDAAWQAYRDSSPGAISPECAYRAGWVAAQKAARPVDGETPPDDPRCLTDWLWYVRHYERTIYVREQVDGRWNNVPLSALAPDRWAYHILRMQALGMVPCRVRPAGEVAP